MYRAHTIVLACLFVATAVAQTPTARLDVLVTDAAGRPLNAARVELADASGPLKSGETDELGHLLFAGLKPQVYSVTVSMSGYLSITKPGLQVSESMVSLTMVLNASEPQRESIEVRGTVLEVEESASVPNRLPPNQARELPNRPATVADALPLTPGVVREPGGALILSSSPEHRSALIVNSADVTDPATGQFGLTVPIDSVDVLNVYQTAYLAEYGRFTAGLVSVETKRGGDKWKWDLNDPLPEFFIRSWHLRGLKTATPRVNFEGPIVANKLFISEGFEYEVRKTAVYTLPFPDNLVKQAGINSFSQLDWVASPRHLATMTFHAAPRRIGGLGMDFFNPRPTTPDTSLRNYTGTVADRLTVWRGLLENRFSVTRFDTYVWGRGARDLVITPAGNSGNYFADRNRTASRISGASSYSFAPIERLGSHQFKVGGYAASSRDDGILTERPINVEDMAGRRLLRIAFPRIRNFDVDDLEKSFFAQDHWILTPRLAVDVGVRTEAQQISGAFRIAPRGGFAWTPAASTRTVLRGGFGLFYDRVPLNVYAFNRYPNRVMTFYDPPGENPVTYVFANTLGQNRVRFPFVSQQPVDGNFSPRSVVWNLQVEQPVTRKLRLRANWLTNDADGLVTLDRVAPDPDTGVGAFLLEGTGRSRYSQLDLLAQLRLRDDREMLFSYTHSRARGDLNDFGRFLGPIPTAIIRDNQYGRLSTDLPNRFLAWGVIKLPAKFQIAPVAEYRSGFPYLETTAAQEYSGVPYRNRFPRFLSIDARVSKDLKVAANHAVRVSISGFNLTNHFNPEAVHGNVADPAYGYFFGHRGRRFTADFDFLF